LSNYETKEQIMKKIIILAGIVVLCTIAAIAMIRVSSGGAAASMGEIEMSKPSLAARIVAGLKAQFTSGNAEMQRSFAARQNVKSFRMKTLLQLHPGHPLETVVEVSCPDRERFTTTIGEKAYHAVRIGGKAYVEQQDGSWAVQDTAAEGWSPCGANPGEPAPWAVMNEGRDPTAVLAKMLDKTEITRGAFVGTTDGNCRQWIMSVKLPGGTAHGHGASGLHYTVCIDPDQHLPVAVVMGGGGMVTTYSDWNKPIQIDAPKM
jgi:hypothetical protein